MPESLLHAAEATALLGVKPATLYAYVSRGLIRSEAGPGGSRQRLYHAEDVRALVARQELKRDPAGAAQGAAAGALEWGMPVLDSALTRIAGGTLSYRGRDAVALANSATVEEVAALLWTGDAGGWTTLPLRARMNLGATFPRGGATSAVTSAEAFAHALAHAGAQDIGAQDSRPEQLPARAARVLSLLYATLERQERRPQAPDLPLHIRLARAWGVSGEADLLRRALVLLADHELNVSTFAARVTASSGAGLPHAALAALCALQGPRHGRAAFAAHEVLAHSLSTDARTALRTATQRHAFLPGFDHHLYPDGDPRAHALLGALQAAQPKSPAVQAVRGLQAVALAETGEHTNIDLALAALTHTLGRGPDDALTLFALARGVGWMAHAIETVLSGSLIRPRARYTGL
ncbi:citrate synthase family protein [Deinococcus humi]|uniref:citrate synthase (unknown stereospecificity) n=1 Tax=Deinococcus humi TaxID=662880 RepID=A0A7W8NGE7_9DEIO|nr:citrate synthase family protein [Deinococcus humi]MBB5364725.1 citrate synthase [Deinococcus humi]GGO34390.1 citrate synthase [Deinococcus humi]